MRFAFLIRPAMGELTNESDQDPARAVPALVAKRRRTASTRPAQYSMVREPGGGRADQQQSRLPQGVRFRT